MTFDFLQDILEKMNFLCELENKKKWMFPSLTSLLLLGFILFSWPFVGIPITDGDVDNWTGEAALLSQNFNFLTGANDQAHGPILIWTGALFLKLFGPTLYAVNAFNIFVSTFGLWLIYFFSKKCWNNKVVSIAASILYLSTLAPVYLAKTPMYDWPATIFYFGFCGFYYLFIRDKKINYFTFALICLSLGSLSRFSICLGLAGIYMTILSIYYKRGVGFFIRDGFLIAMTVILANMPWFIGQVSVEGSGFIKEFIVDNVKRYVKSTRGGENARIRYDFYGLPIYALIGLFPYTFMALASFFQKKFWKRLKNEPTYVWLLAGFLPALILFSFSGHTKLARYIAYIYPFIFLLLAHSLIVFDLNDIKYRIKSGRISIGFGIVFLLLLIQQGIQFSAESQESLGFILNILILVGSLMMYSYFLVTKFYKDFERFPTRILASFSLIYFIFFTTLAIQIPHTPFLNHVQTKLLKTLVVENK